LQDYAENTQETTLNGNNGETWIQYDTIANILKCQIGQHHVEDLIEMIKMDTWITQFGVRTKKLCLQENHRRGPAGPGGLTRTAGLAPPQNTCH